MTSLQVTFNVLFFSVVAFLLHVAVFLFLFCFIYFFVDRFPRSFAENVGCEMASLKACAKKKSFQDLSSAQLKVFDYLNFFRFAPVVDGYFMPGMCYAIIKQCLSQGQPVWELYTISSLCLYFWFWFTTNGGFLRMIFFSLFTISFSSIFFLQSSNYLLNIHLVLTAIINNY